MRSPSSCSILSAKSARSRHTSSKLATISSSKASTASRSYPPMNAFDGFTCRISTGVSVIASSPSMQAVEDVDRDREKDIEGGNSDHRREVERPEGRQHAAPRPQVGIADVVEEPLDPVQPHRVRHPHPGGEDERQDQQRVDIHEDLQKALDAVHSVVEQAEDGATAHAAQFGLTGRSPGVLRLIEEAAALEQPRALLSGYLDISRRQQKHLVRDALHAAVERIRQAAREVDQAFR